MKFGDIVLRKDEVSGEEYLEWSTERESKTRHGEQNEHQRSFRPKRTRQTAGNVQCLASKSLLTGDQQLTAAKSPESPFFLAVRHRRNQKMKFGS